MEMEDITVIDEAGMKRLAPAGFRRPEPHAKRHKYSIVEEHEFAEQERMSKSRSPEGGDMQFMYPGMMGPEDDQYDSGTESKETKR